MSDENSPLIPCDEAVRQLWDYLEGSIVPDDQVRVEEHLDFCRRCCGEVEFVDHLRSLLASQAAEAPPSQMIQRLGRFVEEL